MVASAGTREPKNELYWGRGTVPSARQSVDQPEAETETVPSEPPSRLVAAPPEKPEIAEAMPAEWRATAADQLLALTCCWPELEEPAQPPAWPLALLPLGLYPLWWIAKPRRGLRAVRAGDAGRVAARSRLYRHNGRDSIRERREVSAIGVVRERRSATRGDEQLSSGCGEPSRARKWKSQADGISHLRCRDRPGFCTRIFQRPVAAFNRP
jgi:hypothetical protein